jgi:hypothetical protein
LEEEFGHKRSRILEGIKGRRTKKIECDQALHQLAKMFSNIHTMLLLMICWPNPCLKLINHCSSKKNHGCDVAKYFATLVNNIHVANKYINNIP